MPRTNFLKILLFAAVILFLPASGLFGQERTSGAIDPARCWVYPTGDAAAISLAAHQERAYIAFPGAKIDAVGPDGKRIWSTELGGEITSDLLAHENGVVLITSARADGEAAPPPGTLRSLSLETGLTIWSKALDEAGRHYLHLYNGWVIVVSSQGSIQALSASTGTVIWKREIASGFTGKPHFSGKVLTVASTSDQLFTVALASGEIERMRKIPFRSSSVLHLSSIESVVGDERGNITAYVNGSSEKPLWRFKSGGEISALIEVGPSVLAASHDNFVYFLAGRNGNVLWKRRLAGRALYASLISARQALVSSTEDNGAAVIDLEGGKVVGHLTFSEGESLMSEPIVTSEVILTATQKTLYAFSLNGCPANKESGAAK